MLFRTISFLFVLVQLINANERCIVPDILLKTIKITENEASYPFLIRTNQSSTLEKFKKISKTLGGRNTKDTMVIDCINLQNCVNISTDLIRNNITNLDLGLFQINYDSFKYPLFSYFDKNASYKNACKVIQEKIKINKDKWSWEVLASYHSMTPEYNKIYKKKLIKNYIKLSKKENSNNFIKSEFLISN